MYHPNIFNKPNGPSISTIGRAATADRRFFFEGCKILKLTSGGIVNGARPICDARLVEDENDRDPAGKAGRRNAGIEAEGAEAIALSKPFDRAVESIVDYVRETNDHNRDLLDATFGLS
jgi:hypothetical protein